MNVIPQKIDKKTINSIHLLRAFAALLIINSHADKLFPSNISFLATGGSIGNAIFFFTSGYTLSIGIRKSNTGYFSWLQKRIVRLYPSVLIYMFISYILLNSNYDWQDWIFFNGSWFLQAILLYYFIFYPIINYLDNYLNHIFISTFVFFCFYLLITYNPQYWTIDIMDNPTKVHWIYYFMTMLLGAIVTKSISSESTKQPPLSQLNIFYCVKLVFTLSFSILIFYLPKIIFNKFDTDGSIQLIYPIFLCIVTYLMYQTSELFIKVFKRNYIQSYVSNGIIFIANLTLDIYIVHFIVIHTIRDASIVFPINYILTISITIMLAHLLNFLSNRLLSLTNRK